ncbi:hypothetical protein CVT25_000991 [Psilocybe cyanescens]|uniref:Uncharacterized protein n=1 Tax=Psilocybe cyanescens TaxID=93625 RepID=A0A409XMG9_PSICY|nr:hypothetical protein CVT25_000991 [Psilocybe cyanescens]
MFTNENLQGHYNPLALDAAYGTSYYQNGHVVGSNDGFSRQADEGDHTELCIYQLVASDQQLQSPTTADIKAECKPGAPVLPQPLSVLSYLLHLRICDHDPQPIPSMPTSLLHIRHYAPYTPVAHEPGDARLSPSFKKITVNINRVIIVRENLVAVDILLPEEVLGMKVRGGIWAFFHFAGIPCKLANPSLEQGGVMKFFNANGTPGINIAGFLAERVGIKNEVVDSCFWNNTATLTMPGVLGMTVPSGIDRIFELVPISQELANACGAQECLIRFINVDGMPGINLADFLAGKVGINNKHKESFNENPNRNLAFIITSPGL